MKRALATMVWLTVSLWTSACGRAGSGGMGGAGGAGGAGDAAARPSTNALTCVPGQVERLFPYSTPDSAWHTIELTPADGMARVRGELLRLKAEELDHPVRLRLAPGTYAAAGAGAGEIFVDQLMRPSTAPVLLDAVDKAPNATVLAQGLNLVGVSYFAIDGVTIGPASVGAFHQNGPCDQAGNCFHDAPAPLAAQAGLHIAGTALAIHSAGQSGGHLDFSVYGRYQPSHDIVIRRVTIQNVFDPAERSGRDAEGGGSDGIKLNQAQDVWVVDSMIRQTSRHGIDNVGVHGACFLRDTIEETGLGLGIEAKGGSVDVTVDSCVLRDVRKVELGGEYTDATYYWSAEAPGSAEHYAYEARRTVVRNNLILDAREGALEFSGCHDCAAVNNTVVFSAGFDTSFGGGDAVREVDSAINRDGAGNDCVDAAGDYVESCWGVGPYPADLVQTQGPDGTSKVSANARNTLENNVFASIPGLWGPALNPYNHPNPTHSFGLASVDYNYWWNGASPLSHGGDPSGWLTEGPHSTYTGTSPAPSPAFTAMSYDSSSLSALASSARAAFVPLSGSPLVGRGNAQAPSAPSTDGADRSRPAPPAIGALEAH